jgi:hypothetical protein
MAGLGRSFSSVWYIYDPRYRLGIVDNIFCLPVTPAPALLCNTGGVSDSSE